MPKSVKLTSGHNTIAKVTPSFCQKKFPCAKKLDVSEYSPEALRGEIAGLCEQGVKRWDGQAESRIPKRILYTFDLKSQKGHLKDVSKDKSSCFSNSGNCVLTESSIDSFIKGTGAQVHNKESGGVLHFRNNRKYFPDFDSFDHRISPFILNFVHAYLVTCNLLRDKELSPLEVAPPAETKKKGASAIKY